MALLLSADDYVRGIPVDFIDQVSDPNPLYLYSGPKVDRIGTQLHGATTEFVWTYMFRYGRDRSSR